MMSRVIDTLVMLGGAVIIGWHLVPPDAARSRAPSAATGNTGLEALDKHRVTVSPEPEPEPRTRVACPEPDRALNRPIPTPTSTPDPDELPEAYRDIIGPLAAGNP